MKMKPWRFHSLTMRIWAYFVAMLFFVVLTILIFNVIIFNRYEEDRTYRNLQIFQYYVLNNISRSLRFPAAGEDFFDNPRQHPDEQFRDDEGFRKLGYFLVQKGPVPIIIDNKSTRNLRVPDRFDLLNRMAATAARVNAGSGRFFLKYGRLNIFYLVKKFRTGGYDFYIVTYSHQPDLRQDYTQLILISLAVLLLSLVVAKLISNNLSRPLKSLEEYSARIARKEWSDPLEADREDEIGRLVRAMNHMQTSLKNADEDERAFLQSISHDLKTPVMVIKSYAEAILDGVYIDNLEETARIISNESSHLERKIKQLLYFNSLNYIMENDKTAAETRLDQLCRDLYERFKLIRNDIHWEINLAAVTLKCSPEKITVALENIVDNQLRFAESIIAITLKDLKKEALIEIYNDGPAIDAANLDKIFDMFYRDKKGHFGLGLAISQRIIEFHHGVIEARNHPKGVSFIIRIPLDAS